jgi:hypothetical protein
MLNRYHLSHTQSVPENKMNLSEETLGMIKGLRKDVTTAGITTGTNLNFYYLEPQAKNIYPVFYPLLASIPRVNPTFNGMKIGGTAVNWKAIVGIDAGGYPAISEGNRNAFMDITQRDYSAAYKYLGKDTEVSFQAQQTGMGFDDNIALAQLSMLNALLNDEERMVLFGNSGSAGNGYQLGTCPTPVATAVAGGTIPAATVVTLYCVALTPWGAQLATGTGVRLPFQRQNADGSTDIINGGTSVYSAASNSLTISGSNQTVTASVTPIVGAVAYAWYVSSNGTPLPSNAYFYAVTSFCSVSVTALPATSDQLLSSVDPNSNKGLTTDNSANVLDFDGLLTWAFRTSTSSQPSYWKDLQGAGFTPNGDGTIAEFEAVLDFLWLNYKITVDKIYLGGNLISAVTRCILATPGADGGSRYVFMSDEGGSIVGGTKVAQYRSKYSNTGAAKVVDVVTHPWLPQGTVFFDLVQNPYPAAGDAIPAVRRIVSLEDHFSIKWPYRKLQHELGVYCFETLEVYIPFGLAVITGASNTVA